MRERSVLVTGGQGYVGSVLTEELVRNGFRVVVVDNDFVPGARLRLPGVSYLTGDVCDSTDWESCLAEVSTVVHLAAVVGDPACSVDSDLAWRTNYLGTISVAEACRRQGVERFVFASTCSTYGVSEHEADIWSPLRPRSAYATSKVLAEHHLLSWAGTGPQLAILRLATLHGLSPRMRFDLAVNVMTASAVLQRRVEVHGGRQWRPFLHVRDAARAVLMLLRADQRPNPAIYNCGSGTENYRIDRLGELVLQEVPGARLMVHPQADDPRDYRVNFDPIRDELGFTPRFRVRDTVREIRDAILAGRFRDYTAPVYNNHLASSVRAG